MAGVEVILEGYLGTSLSRAVDEQEFIRPVGPGGSVLLRLTVRRRAGAAWLPPVALRTPPTRKNSLRRRAGVS